MLRSALLLLAACTVQRATFPVELVPVEPAQITASGVSLLWWDATHIYWSWFVHWQEAGGHGAPHHVDYIRCRAPWGGLLSLNDCVLATEAEIAMAYQRRFGWRGQEIPGRGEVWGGPKVRAWWWRGDPAIEPLLRILALGAPELL